MAWYVSLTFRNFLAAALAWPPVCAGTETAALVRHSDDLQITRAKAAATAEVDGDRPTADAAVVRAATQAQCRRLVALRADGTIGDAAFQRVEEELD